MTKKTDQIQVTDNQMQEMAVIRQIFFESPPKKQRKALRLLIGWSLKQYVKSLWQSLR